MLKWAKPKTAVGLDVGSSSVKAVELARKGAAYELLNLGLEPLDPAAVSEGLVVDSPAVARAVGKVLAENSIQTGDVATSVSGHSVMIKKVVVAGDEPGEVAESIGQEVEQHVQSNTDEIRWDYQILGPAQGAGAYEVMLVAVKKEKIANHLDVIEQAGKRPTVLDIDAFALQNAFEMNYDLPSDAAVALLNVGASTMNINIVRAGIPLFTRDVALGGNQYTDALQKELALSPADAEKVKVGYEVPNVPAAARVAPLKSVSEMLINEIQKMLDFFRQTTAPDNIARAYVAGGSARVHGLVEILGEELGVPVEVMNPFSKIAIKDPKFDMAHIQEIAPRMSVAVGLALRGFDEP